jgi:methylmalonyl-CoA mutase cobalamin-binding subunit
MRTMIESTSPGPSLAIVLNRDLLFGSRIRSALAGLGLKGRFVSTAEDFVGALSEQPGSVAIGIVDMNSPIAWEVIREALSAADAGAVPTLAFGPHVDVEGRRAAKAAGVTRIVSNGQFHSDMAGLIDRYRRR